MIRLRVISRIDVDKDFFFDYLFVIYLLKKEDIDVKIQFIGKVFNDIVFNNIKRNSIVLRISDRVEFTNKSIPLKEITDNEYDYFINASIGDFIGYSSIECLYSAFKTIFYNVDLDLVYENDSITFSKNTTELYTVLKKINEDKDIIDMLIMEENRKTLANFHLTNSEKIDLLNLISN